MKRLFIVYNPNSSKYCHVKTEILDCPENFKGFILGKYAIKKTSFNKNVADFSKFLADGDLVLSAGGDATAAIAANAIIESKKDATLAVLPYGNFNDLARTLNTFKLKDIFSKTATTKKLHPLSVYVDGKFWRYATCYTTIGMTAEAVELFDDENVRKQLQKGHKSSWRSYIHLMVWYFKNRHKKQFIPDFKLNGKPQHKKTSDYAAVNGYSMCRVMKGGRDYLEPKTFRSMTDRLTNFPRLFVLMVKSILYRTPGKDTVGDILEFDNLATVEIQAEGEYEIFENIKKIEIKKGDACLKVIQN
ncbi:MAG: diacylglycerol kinase family protein [Candidatus Saccharibacteria bacterium]|nr:diacylglycerol kinase family protein [Candidatus Saccharibacteria bacterium]